MARASAASVNMPIFANLGKGSTHFAQAKHRVGGKNTVNNRIPPVASMNLKARGMRMVPNQQNQNEQKSNLWEEGIIEISVGDRP